MEVIAHRGASGYLPEHTLPAYALAYGQGAPWIEVDVVLSADGVPIGLHDLTLERTTDVAQVFPNRARSDGRFHALDFTYAEIARLRTVERQSGRFPHPGYRVPRLEDVLDLVDGLNRASGRRVGIYPELKSPSTQPGLAEAVLAALSGYELPVLLQSFEPDALQSLDTEFDRVALLREPPSALALEALASYAAGIGIAKGRLYRDPGIIERAHERGLFVHAYTLRADNVGAGFASFEAEALKLASLGVDAVFTDHPDLALVVLEGFCD